ncbi:MAG: hypothetical protein GYA86_04655 [Firmicutes bacterium]|nr:hypothetical protein [Bacillota bacterium]
MLKKIFLPIVVLLVVLLPLNQSAEASLLGRLFKPSVKVAPLTSTVPLNKDGIHEAKADDGSTIFLYRYAPYNPKGKPEFRTNGTPIVLFTGITMNMNQYLSCTPPGMERAYRDVYVPPVKDAPAWALTKNKKDYEPYIKEDKMRYYSLAHYLWLEGYDPWFVNYRGTGRGLVQSKGTNPDGITTLDTWATQDTPAAIAKVHQVTGKNMYIGGHSTGGLVCYDYLQGAYMDSGSAKTDRAKEAYYRLCYALGFMPHVKASSDLAVERNNMIKGFIGIDPAGVPDLPVTLLNTTPFWTLVGSRLFLPLDSVSDNLIQLFPSKPLVGIVEGLFGLVNLASSGNSIINNFFGYLNFWVVENMDPCLEDWTVRYAVGSAPIRGFGHYMDMGLNYTLREHYLNGKENYLSPKLIAGVAGPRPKDGYYYYSDNDNMARMSVPAIVFSNGTGSLVSFDETKNFLMEKKTKTKYDEQYGVEGSGHFDLAMGLEMPAKGGMFEKLGAWLEKVETQH